MMSVPRLAALFVVAVITMPRGADAGDASPPCNEDPRIIEACRWVRGVTYFGFEGNTFFSVKGDDVTYVLDENRALPFDEIEWTNAGEFEFCRLKDATLSFLADVDGNRWYYPHAHGCINAARVVIPLPDDKVACEYAGRELCPDTPSKP